MSYSIGDVACHSMRVGFCFCRLVTTSRATPLLKGVCSRDGMSPGMLRVLSPATPELVVAGVLLRLELLFVRICFIRAYNTACARQNLGEYFCVLNLIGQTKTVGVGQPNCSRPDWGSVLSNCRTVLQIRSIVSQLVRIRCARVFVYGSNGTAAASVK